MQHPAEILTPARILAEIGNTHLTSFYRLITEGQVFSTRTGARNRLLSIYNMVLSAMDSDWDSLCEPLLGQQAEKPPMVRAQIALAVGTMQQYRGHLANLKAVAEDCFLSGTVQTAARGDVYVFGGLPTDADLAAIAEDIE